MTPAGKRRKKYRDANRGKVYAQKAAWRLAKREEAAGRPMPGTCEVCGDAPGKRGLQFDHCHTSGNFRGWLCQHCNLALGHVRDAEWRLFALIAYLKKNEPALAVAA